METNTDQRAIDRIYKWFLNLVAVSHGLFAARNILFYPSVVGLSHPPEGAVPASCSRRSRSSQAPANPAISSGLRPSG
jgi:hypothetical protein